MYPPREICPACLSDGLSWRAENGDGVLIAETTLYSSTSAYFRERLPLRVGAIRLDVGPVIAAHLRMNAHAGDRVRVTAVTDRSGNAAFIASAQRERCDMGEETLIEEFICHPRNRNVLITNVSTPTGLAMVKSMRDHGARQIYAGCADPSIEFAGKNVLTEMQGVSLAALDLRSSSSVATLARQIGHELDILINTSHSLRHGSITCAGSYEAARSDAEIEIFGLMRLFEAFAEPMRVKASGVGLTSGAWVNIFSIYALANAPSCGVSAALQAGAFSLSQSMRAEFAGCGVKLLNVFHDNDGAEDSRWSSAVAAATLDGLCRGLETVVVGVRARDIYKRWREDPSVLERELVEQ